MGMGVPFVPVISVFSLSLSFSFIRSFISSFLLPPLRVSLSLSLFVGVCDDYYFFVNSSSWATRKYFLSTQPAIHTHQ